MTRAIDTGASGAFCAGGALHEFPKPLDAVIPDAFVDQRSPVFTGEQR